MSQKCLKRKVKMSVYPEGRMPRHFFSESGTTAVQSGESVRHVLPSWSQKGSFQGLWKDLYLTCRKKWTMRDSQWVIYCRNKLIFLQYKQTKKKSFFYSLDKNIRNYIYKNISFSLEGCRFSFLFISAFINFWWKSICQFWKNKFSVNL